MRRYEGDGRADFAEYFCVVQARKQASALLESLIYIGAREQKQVRFDMATIRGTTHVPDALDLLAKLVGQPSVVEP